MLTLKLIESGGSVAVIIPPGMLAQLNAKVGDNLTATVTPGGYLVAKLDEETGEQLEAGRELMRRYRDTFKALAE